MAFDKGFKDPQLILSGTEIIELEPSNTTISMTEDHIFVKDILVNLQYPAYKNLSARYTTDGTAPNKDAPIFTTQLSIEQTKGVKVMLVDTEGFQGAVFEKKYVKAKPLSALKPKNIKEGLSYSYYEGDFTSVPNFKELKLIEKGSTMVLDPQKVAQRIDHYAVQYRGFISVPKTGAYKFYIESDDGSKLFLDDELVIDNIGFNDTTKGIPTRTGMIALKKGFHPIRIEYFQDVAREELELQYSGPGVERSRMLFWH